MPNQNNPGHHHSEAARWLREAEAVAISAGVSNRPSAIEGWSTELRDDFSAAVQLAQVHATLATRPQY